MDLQVTQENLQKAVGNVARVAAGARTSLPILNNILLQTDNNRLRLSATNLDIALSQHIGTKIKKGGSITVPARLFQDLVTNLPKAPIQLIQRENKLSVRSNGYNSTINGIVSEEFPDMPTIKKPTELTLSAHELKDALAQVVFAASGDEARPVLTGVLFHSKEGKLYIVATDSYRLAEKTLKQGSKDITVLVPGTSSQDLLRIIGDYEGDIIMSFDEQQVRFSVGDAELVTRQVDGEYPDYKKLIPKEFANTASVTKQDVVSATKIAGLFSRENAGSIVLSIDEENGCLEVRSIVSQVGDNSTSVTGSVRGDGDVTLNSRYLLDVLNVLDDNEVSISFNGKLDPIVVKGKKDDYLHIIMPLKS